MLSQTERHGTLHSGLLLTNRPMKIKIVAPCLVYNFACGDAHKVVPQTNRQKPIKINNVEPCDCINFDFGDVDESSRTQVDKCLALANLLKNYKTCLLCH